MNEQERQERQSTIEEPGAAERGYQAQPASAPVREEPGTEERTATTKTAPMGRTTSPEQPTSAEPPTNASSEQRTDARRSEQQSGGSMQDQKWQYFAGQWDMIQAGFVDDPRRTVERADRLVAEVVQHLEKMFSDERARLESQWSGGDKIGTEDLRLAMQRYREFFQTLIGR